MAQTERWMPDLILMDIRMPGKDGLEATREIKLRYPYVKIVLITVSDDAAHLFEALKQGAQGYLLKNLEPGTWLEYLRAIASDEAPLSSELALRILQEFPVTKKESGEQPPLTSREREILGWVAQGMTNREIAGVLHISDQTVKNHLKNILQKLHLENRVN
ncbi:Transcriptional regulatory protein DegU [compost metagenome]